MGVLCIFLANICYFDYKYRKIPNWLLVLMMLSGMAKNMFENGVGGGLFFLLAMIIVILLFYPFFKIGALGAGDVKLFGVCSGYFPQEKILYFLFFSMLIASAISLVKLIIRKSIKELRTLRIPLAGPVIGSVLLYIGGGY